MGYGKRVQALRVQVNEHISECVESMSLMNEDVANAEREVRMKKAEMKEMEKKFKEEMEFTNAELKQLMKDDDEARESCENVIKGQQAATVFGEVFSNAEASMREITAELKEYDHLFREEDTATEKRRTTLAAIFKRAKERRGSESEAAGTPVKPSGADDEKKRVPIPKKMPAEHKARFLEKRKRGKSE